MQHQQVCEITVKYSSQKLCILALEGTLIMETNENANHPGGEKKWE